MNIEDIKISSVFKTIQGEGRHSGFPVTFIRLFTNKCFPTGERCHFCDTIKQDYYSDNTSNFNEFDIETERVVITGGEPLSIDLKVFLDLLTYLKNKGHKIDVETNGAFLRQSQIKEYSYSIMDKIFRTIDHITISPKLMSSMLFEYDYCFHKELNNVFRKKIDYKFVVSDISSIMAVEYFVLKVKIMKQNIFLMAQTPATNEWKKQVVEECIKKEWNYSPRLHLDIWGDVKYEI